MLIILNKSKDKKPWTFGSDTVIPSVFFISYKYSDDLELAIEIDSDQLNEI
jgi:hypothetical protein